MEKVMEKVELRRGDRGMQVKLVQEWLCLHGILVDIDGAFGPATEAAVRKFQQERRPGGVTGVVDDITMKILLRPLDNAMLPAVPAANVGLTVIKVARQHLREHPREVGGENSGPWCRYYLDGNEGQSYPWCAAFVCAILKQAFKAHGKGPPFPRTYSCDSMAKTNSSRLVRPANGEEAHRFGLRPGAIFLIRKTETDWIHTGICLSLKDQIIETCEGNTNVAGAREGIEVRERIRGYSKKDFIPI